MKHKGTSWIGQVLSFGFSRAQGLAPLPEPMAVRSPRCWWQFRSLGKRRYCCDRGRSIFSIAL